MGTVFVAGVYGVGKSTLCDSLAEVLSIPSYSAGNLISQINGEIYGANKAVQNKYSNQDILALAVDEKLKHSSTILLAGHFCIFDKHNHVDRLPLDVFQKLAILKDCGYKQASLAVQKANYAVKMYRKVGFEIAGENEQEYIMIARM